MQKTRSTLLHFFSEPLVDVLLPHLLNAERTHKKGEEKKALLIHEFGKNQASDRLSLTTREANLSIPWRVIFPVIIDACIRILNIILGKEWVKDEDNELAPPRT